MNINTYETVVIIKPNCSDIPYERRKLSDLLQSYSKIKRIDLEDIGDKALAYEIRRFKRGYYMKFTWQGTKENVGDVEHHLNIDKEVLKFLTIKLEDNHPKIKLLLDLNPPLEKVNSKIDALDVLLGLANYN